MHFFSKLRKTSANSAQGTIEYLVILAVVVVISLVIVGLVASTVSSPSQQINESGDKFSVVSGGISVVESVIDAQGDSLIRLSNNSSDAITLNRISVGGVDNDFSEQIVGLDSKVFSLSSLNSSCPCESGQKKVKCEFKIVYTTATGITQTEYRTINAQCVTNSTPSNPDTVVEPISDLPVSLCGAISTPIGYTEISSCPATISSAGNYILTTNLTCDLIIETDDVNINGNYCTLNGDVNASGQIIGENGYSNLYLESINILGGVYSKGSDGIETGGEGGTIFILDTNISGQVSTIGGMSTMVEGSYEYGGGGNGGALNIINSNLTAVDTTGGINLRQYGEGGDGGNVVITNSTLTSLITSGGQDYFEYLVGGSIGNITITDSDLNSIIANGYNSYSSVGTITINGSNISTINADGGNLRGHAMFGANVIIIDSNLISITSSGGNGNYQGGAGGVITLTNSLVSQLTATGGIGVEISAEGGEISLTNSTAGQINVSAGECQNSYGVGGLGGSVDLNKSTVASIISNGGAKCSFEYSRGGIITLLDSNVISSITANGGEEYGDQQGGAVTISNSIVGGAITTNGGSGYMGGNGGTIIISGANTQTGACFSNGKNEYGAGGTITINSICPTLENIGAFTCTAGEPNGVAGNCPHTCS